MFYLTSRTPTKFALHFDSLIDVISEHVVYRLLISYVPHLITIFLGIVRLSKDSNYFKGLFRHIIKSLIFKVTSFLTPNPQARGPFPFG
jgi:hypothetical protein